MKLLGSFLLLTAHSAPGFMPAPSKPSRATPAPSSQDSATPKLRDIRFRAYKVENTTTNVFRKYPAGLQKVGCGEKYYYFSLENEKWHSEEEEPQVGWWWEWEYIKESIANNPYIRNDFEIKGEEKEDWFTPSSEPINLPDCKKEPFEKPFAFAYNLKKQKWFITYPLEESSSTTPPPSSTTTTTTMDPQRLLPPPTTTTTATMDLQRLDLSSNNSENKTMWDNFAEKATAEKQILQRTFMQSYHPYAWVQTGPIYRASVEEYRTQLPEMSPLKTKVLTEEEAKKMFEKVLFVDFTDYPKFEPGNWENFKKQLQTIEALKASRKWNPSIMEDMKNIIKLEKALLDEPWQPTMGQVKEKVRRANLEKMMPPIQEKILTLLTEIATLLETMKEMETMKETYRNGFVDQVVLASITRKKLAEAQKLLPANL